MTDKELIEALRNYAKSCMRGNTYNFNPGLALIIANRIEKLTAIDIKFNIGDRVWIPDCIYDEWFVLNEEGYIIDGVQIFHGAEGNELKMYTLKNHNDFQKYPQRLCFGSYEECKEWCDKKNKL